MTMTAEPNRQPEGIPTGGQFAAKVKSDDVVVLAASAEKPQSIGRVLSNRYFTAKAHMDAYDQNEWVRGIQEEHPDAAYAKVNLEIDAGGTYTAGIDLYTADGTPIELDSHDEAALEDSFDTDWDMLRHLNDQTRSLFGEDEVFSLPSIQDHWATIESFTEAPSDPFAHLTGMDKIKAQGAYAREMSSEAAAAYVVHLASEIRAAHPDAARINVSRVVDVEFGHHFTLESVTSADGDVLDVDLDALQDKDFHYIFLDPHTGYDSSADRLYIDLIPAS
jgi:hypothetical protein